MPEVGAPITSEEGAEGDAPERAPDPVPSAPPPRRFRRRRRRLLLSLVVLAALVALAPYALSVAPVRRWVAERVSASLGRRVTIGGLTARWWSGIEARDVEVHNPEGFTGPPLLAVDRVEAHVPVFGAVFGDVAATVACEHPVVTLQRTPEGRANWTGLAQDDGKSSKRATLTATVTDGWVTAYGLGSMGEGPQVLDGITATLQTSGARATRATFSAKARGAAQAGGDATISGTLDLREEGDGSLLVKVPPLDLAHLSGLLSALGVEGASGSLQAAADVRFGVEGDPTGAFTAKAASLRGRAAGGSFALESLSVTLSPRAETGGVRVGVDAVATGLSVRGLTARDEGLVEPRLAVTGAVFVGHAGDVAFGDAHAPLSVAGRSVSASLTGRLTHAGGEGATADLSGKASAVLSPTLGRLLGLLSTRDEDLRGTLTVDGRVQGSGGALSVAAEARVADLVMGGGAGSTPWTEPLVTASVDGAWDGRARTLSLEKAALAAGAVSGGARTDKGPFVVTLSPRPTAQGTLALDADLARLGSARAHVPALDGVRGGQLHAEAMVTAGDAPKATWSLAVRELAFAPGAAFPTGYVERDVRASGVFTAPAEGSPTLEVKTFASALATLDRASTATLRLDPEGPVLVEEAKVVVDLAAVSRAFGTAAGLAPGESLSGLLETTVAAAPGGSGAAGPFDLVVLGRDVKTTDATGKTLAPGRLEARAKVARDLTSATTSVREAVVNAFGLSASGEAVFLSPPGQPSMMRTLRLEVHGDLGGSGPLLVALGVIAPEARLTGTIDGKATLSLSGAGRSLLAHADVRRLSYLSAPGASPLEETNTTLDVDATLDATPGLVEVKAAKLVGAALTASATGRIQRTGDASALDFVLDVDGDGRGLADRLKGALGAGWEDLTGEGRLGGHFTLKGSAGEGGRDLLVNGAAQFRKFQSGGVAATDGRLTVSRAKGGDPVAARVESGVNGGKLDATVAVSLGVGESPWTARAQVRGMDTAPLLTGSGPGRWLPMLLPALVPGSRATPVISGRLDADLSFRSDSVHQPANTNSLTGTGAVRMTQGSVADSTIFRSLGAGDGLTKLVAVVPAVGGAIADLGKSLLFSELSSRFEVGGRRIHLLEVRLTSPRALVAFDGWVGFDGIVDLDVPLVLGGDLGTAIEPYVPDRTIPLKVTGLASEPRVRPNLKLENVGKDLLDEIRKRLK